MSNKKKWANKEEARSYAIKASRDGNRGLTFCAACDYIGWAPDYKNASSAELALYADWLLSRGISYIKEEINNIKWELDLIDYVESPTNKAYHDSLESYLKVAKEELAYLKDFLKRRKKHK